MKRYILLFSIFLYNNCLGQNIGIGIATPLNKVHVLGNLLVNEPYTYTNTLPIAGQTLTMVNGNTLQFASNDSTGRIYDPGGAAGNYNSNLVAQVILNVNSNSRGYELILEDVDLGTGDSLL
ncbi:MAG TPA: hypothetical protein VLR49_02790, partial [Ferruginibacter sp.]|nr:hypothetical protein [Ferruginibacter sp.]